VQRVQRKESFTTIDAAVVGHASPRWEHTKGKTAAELNLKLSQDRAAEVKAYLEYHLQQRINALGGSLEISFTTAGIDHDQPTPPPSITSDAKGQDDTLVEAGGDTKRDDATMRRVDIKLIVTWNVSGETGQSTAVKGIRPAYCDPEATQDWGILFDLTAGAGHAGGGITGGGGKLFNKTMDKEVHFTYWGLGVGLGFQSPNVGIDLKTPTWFRTYQPVTFSMFEGAMALMEQAGGSAIVGGGGTFLKFLGRVASETIFMTGGTLGSVGGDISANLIEFSISSQIPRAQCYPAKEVDVEEEEIVPYEVDLPNVFTHRVLFDTGKHGITKPELAKLETFLDTVMASYQNPDPELQK
jgi:hypothetical protein